MLSDAPTPPMEAHEGLIDRVKCKIMAVMTTVKLKKVIA